MYLFIVYWNDHMKSMPGFHKSAVTLCETIEQRDEMLERVATYTRIDPDLNLSPASKGELFNRIDDIWLLSSSIYAHPTPEFALKENASHDNSTTA